MYASFTYCITVISLSTQESYIYTSFDYCLTHVGNLASLVLPVQNLDRGVAAIGTAVVHHSMVLGVQRYHTCSLTFSIINKDGMFCNVYHSMTKSVLECF